MSAAAASRTACAIAGCAATAGSSSSCSHRAIAHAVRDAAAALKLRQLEPLYALHEAAAFDDAPHPLGTAAPLVTRPCAVVRGALAYPTDAGVAPLPFECEPSAHNAEADLKSAINATKSETAALRNALRREGVAANVFVAPPVDKLGYERMAPVAAVGAEVEDALDAIVQLDDEMKAAEREAKAAHDALMESMERLVQLAKDSEEAEKGVERAKQDIERLDAEEAKMEYDYLQSSGVKDPETVKRIERQRRAADAQLEAANAVVNKVKADSAKAGEENEEARAAEETAKAKVSGEGVSELLSAAAATARKTKKVYTEAMAAAESAAKADKAAREKMRNALAATLTNESVYSTDFALPTLRRLVNQTIVTLAAIKHKTADGGCTDAPIAAFLKEELMQSDGVDANDRREGLWAEFRRHLSISQDRLWVFVRLLSGAIGGDVNEIITMADEASQQATKALQAQRVEVAKRVSDTQSKIVESVVGAMLKESRLALDAKDDNLVVMDSQARQDLRDLASGASGRPFFEANVACRNLEKTYEPMKLTQLLARLADVGRQMQRSLDTALTQPGLASASLVELSHPSNSFFVSMKTDASAAVRIAHERLNSELASRGVGRRIALWELVEGGCAVMTTRFAEFCGHILVQNRSATGVSAMYVSRMAIETNAMQARVTLARLANAVEVYAARVLRPAFGSFDPNDPTRPRRLAMDEGARVREADVTHPRPRGDPRVGYGHLYSARSASGWWVR